MIDISILVKAQVIDKLKEMYFSGELVGSKGKYEAQSHRDGVRHVRGGGIETCTDSVGRRWSLTGNTNTTIVAS